MKAKKFIDRLGSDRVVKVIPAISLELYPADSIGFYWAKIVDPPVNSEDDLFIQFEHSTVLHRCRKVKGKDTYTIAGGSFAEYRILFNQARERVAKAME